MLTSIVLKQRVLLKRLLRKFAIAFAFGLTDLKRTNLCSYNRHRRQRLGATVDAPCADKTYLSAYNRRRKNFEAGAVVPLTSPFARLKIVVKGNQVDASLHLLP